MPLFQEVCSAVSCTFSLSTCNFFRLNVQFHFPEKSLHSTSPLNKRSQLNIHKLTFSSISSSKSSISVLLLAGSMSSKTWAEIKTKMKIKWMYVVQNAINDNCYSPMIDRETSFEEEKDFPCQCHCPSNFCQ